jgi:hypothetical protein
MNMKSQFVTTISQALLAAAVLPLMLKAQAPQDLQVARLDAVGFQADASSPLTLQGEPIGTAAWHVLNSPPVSNPFGFLLADSSFSGAACQADYSRNEIVTQDGSSLNLEVYGFRCDPSGGATATGLSKKIGIFSVLGGTGTFQGLIGGTGSIAFDSRADGSVFVSIQGSLLLGAAATDAPRLTHCHGGMCLTPLSLPVCSKGMCGSKTKVCSGGACGS